MEHKWQIASFDELNNNQLYEILRLRQEVFGLEQDCLYIDMDRLDQHCVHIQCWGSGEGTEDRQLLAHQRCLPPGLKHPQSALGRVVTSPSTRGQNLGRELVRRGIAHNFERWPGHAITISAQAHLQTFYTELGFVAQGDIYGEDGIPHIRMQIMPPQAD